MMSLVEKSKLLITSGFGYGSKRAGGGIPPNADLPFEVELVGIGDMKVNISSQRGCCIIL
jgi:FK506-binding protein 1